MSELLERTAEADRLAAAIADRLVVSMRTVDHQVSAVLQRLGVRDRREAAAAAAALGVTPPPRRGRP